MKIAKRLSFLIIALCMMLIFTPATHALTVTSQFKTPVHITINPGETKPVLFAVPNGTTVNAIVAKIERVSSSGTIVGEHYILHAGNQYYNGTINTASTQTIGISYYSPPYNGLIILRSENTTSPVTVRITFYNSIVTP